jgi:hypothetical protein
MLYLAPLKVEFAAKPLLNGVQTKVGFCDMKELRHLRELLDRFSCTPEQIESLMINIRKVMEHEGSQTKYQILNLYANWTAHAVIERSAAGYELLEELTDIMLIYGDPASPRAKAWDPGLFNDLIRTLTAQLRSDLNGFLFDHHLPTMIVVAQVQWGQFFMALAKCLADNPLTFPATMKPNSPADQAWKRIQAKAGMLNIAVHGFRFLFEDLRAHTGWDGLHWEIETAKSTGAGFTKLRGALR